MHSRTLSILLKLHDISKNDPSQEMFLTQNIFFLGGTIPPKKKYVSIFQRIVPYKKIFFQAVTGRELFPTRKKKKQAVPLRELFPKEINLSRQYPAENCSLQKKLFPGSIRSHLHSCKSSMKNAEKKKTSLFSLISLIFTYFHLFSLRLTYLQIITAYICLYLHYYVISSPKNLEELKRTYFQISYLNKILGG